MTNAINTGKTAHSAVTGYPASTAPTYLVLWRQPATSTGNGNAMLPVSKSDETGVWYTLKFEDRMIFQTADEANKVVRRIYDEYNLIADVEIVQNEPGFAEQKRRDQFLPAWAWLDKYGRS
jgi:hypothetical protein